MTSEEVNAIFSLADINKDGKLDYAEVRFKSSCLIFPVIFLFQLRFVLNSIFGVVLLKADACEILHYHRTVLMCQILNSSFLLLSVLQIACVYSRTVSGSC